MQNVTQDYLSFLVHLTQTSSISVDDKLDDALARLDYMLEGICRDLRVEYYGPFVGVESLEAHRLVVRDHEWRVGERLWSLKICSAAKSANWRAEWALQGASRMRKPIIVAALPDFFSGFAAKIIAANKQTTAAGQRITRLAAQFRRQPD